MADDPDEPDVANSILLHTKQLANIEPDDTDFDVDILSHIGMVIFTLNQLGIGPKPVLIVRDKTATWTDLLGNDEDTLQAVKSYFMFRTRLAFDPPSTSYAITSFEEQVKQLEYRLDVQVHSNKLRDNPPPLDEDDE